MKALLVLILLLASPVMAQETSTAYRLDRNELEISKNKEEITRVSREAQKLNSNIDWIITALGKIERTGEDTKKILDQLVIAQAVVSVSKPIDWNEIMKIVGGLGAIFGTAFLGYKKLKKPGRAPAGDPI